MNKYTHFIFVLLLAFSCKDMNEEIIANVDSPQFKLLSTETTGINFINDLVSTDDFNVYKYRNFYNGGGVAIGDINNDVPNGLCIIIRVYTRI